MVIPMKNLIAFVFIVLVSCQPKESNEIKVDPSKIFERSILVYPKNYHKSTKRSPVEYIKSLTIPNYLHSDKEIILLSCTLVKEVSKETDFIHGQTYPLDVNLDIVKIIRNNYKGEFKQPTLSLIYLRDLANIATEIQTNIDKNE